jgi:hypothetical protein
MTARPTRSAVQIATAEAIHELLEHEIAATNNGANPQGEASGLMRAQSIVHIYIGAIRSQMPRITTPLPRKRRKDEAA